MGFRVMRLLFVMLGVLTVFFETPAQQKPAPVKKSELLEKPLAVPAPAPAQKSGYVWAGDPITNSYTPSLWYSYNSSGGAITITRSDVGTYSVRFSGLGGGGGNVQVTAYGGGSETCKVAGWDSKGADFIANVRCFSSAGTPADSRYTARVILANAVFGRNGYAWADNPDPKSGSYVPRAAYSNNSSGGAISINRTDVGSYSVRFSGLGGRGSAGGNVQVTAYGPGSETCKVMNWDSGGSDFIANVRCFDSTGKPSDTQYAINVVW